MITISKTQRLISTRLAFKEVAKPKGGGQVGKKNLLGKWLKILNIKEPYKFFCLKNHEFCWKIMAQDLYD